LQEKKQFNYVGYLGGDLNNSTIITILEEPITGKYPEPVFRGIIRSKTSGQDLFYIPEAEIIHLRDPNHPKKDIPITKKVERHLQEVFFMNSQLYLVKDLAIEQELIELEKTDPERSNSLAFGVIYAKEGQTKPIEFWNNETGSPAFDKFLSLLGDRIELQGWSGFRGGLDVQKNTKGTHSIYTHFKEFELMYHVSTYLPFHPFDELKLSRARQIQNDVVVIIFMDGNTSYNPLCMPTNVSHIFIIVQPLQIKENETYYRIGVASKSNVSIFRPDLPYPPIFHHNNEFREFLLTKLINGQIATRKSGLQMMFTRPRQSLINEIVDEYLPAEVKKKRGPVQII